MNNTNIIITAIVIILALAGIVFLSERNQKSEVRDPEGNVIDLEGKEDMDKTDNSLQGTLWIASSIVDTDLPNDVEVSATFGEDGSLSGSSGCNQYNGTYTVDENTILIGENFASTMIACPDPIMTVEAEYLATLAQASSYEISGNVLKLKDSSENMLIEYNASEPTSINGSSWSAIGINNGKEAVVSTIIDSEVTAIFDAEGNMTGSGGCNNYFADYTYTEDTITIGPVGSTRMVCSEPEGVMDQEQSYFSALENSTVYKINKDKMEFRDDSGALQVSFQIIGN